MSFIKHGDGKIVSVVDTDDLTEDQKNAVKKVSEKLTKQSEISADTSKTKKSGS